MNPLISRKLSRSLIRYYATKPKKVNKADFYRLLARSKGKSTPSTASDSTSNPFKKQATTKDTLSAETYNPFKNPNLIKPAKPASSLTFDTKRKDDADDIEFDKVFGYSGNKNKSFKSSRRDVSYREVSRKIAGVTVGKRPIEPDNCCMSGCVNCVWELFNEDLQDWKHQTQQAVASLMKQKTNEITELWPRNFDPPPENLPDEYIPLELRKNKGNHTVVNEMPLGLQVFANFEKMKKAKKASKSKKQIPLENANLDEQRPRV